jgi:hypothetical protein
MFLCYFSRNRRFCENARKHWLCEQKSRFELEKNKKKLPKNRSPNVFEKKRAENLSKADLYTHVGLPKPPKSSPKSSKFEKKSPSKKNPKTKTMEIKPRSPEITGSQAFWDPAGPSIHPSIH